jgi:hypothetical protein
MRTRRSRLQDVNVVGSNCRLDRPGPDWCGAGETRREGSELRRLSAGEWSLRALTMAPA